MASIGIFHIIGLILLGNALLGHCCDDDVCDELYKNVNIFLHEMIFKFVAPFAPPPVFRTKVYNRTGIDFMDSQQVHDTVCKVLKVTSVKELAEVIGLPYEEVNGMYTMVKMQEDVIDLMIQVTYPVLTTVYEFRVSHNNATFPYKDYCCYQDVTELMDTLEEKVSVLYTSEAYKKMSAMIGEDLPSTQNPIDWDKFGLALYESEDLAEFTRISGLSDQLTKDVYLLFGPDMYDFYPIIISGLNSIIILKEQGLLDLKN